MHNLGILTARQPAAPGPGPLYGPAAGRQPALRFARPAGGRCGASGVRVTEATGGAGVGRDVTCVLCPRRPYWAQRTRWSEGGVVLRSCSPRSLEGPTQSRQSVPGLRVNRCRRLNLPTSRDRNDEIEYLTYSTV
jgi:hypothetical protein